MAHIARCHRVVEFERCNTDQQIRKRNADTVRPALSVDLPGTQRRRNRHRHDRDGTGQLSEKALAIMATLWRVCPRDAMSEFEHRHHGHGDLVITGFGNDPFEQLSGVPARSFGGNGGGGIEDQSQAGGSNGSRCAAIAASTSAANSGSMTAVESAGSIAMHSEILRRGGSAGFSTATA